MMMDEIKLLVIENSLANQKKIKKALKNSFFLVNADYAVDLSEVTELFGQKKWDIVITNFSHKNPNYTDVFNFFKKDKLLKTSIIFVLNKRNKELIEKFEDEDAVETITNGLLTSEGIDFLIKNQIQNRLRKQNYNQKLEQLKFQEKKIEKTQRMGGVGSWELSPGTNEITWSEENAKIFGDKLKRRLSFNEFQKYVLKEDLEQFIHVFNLILEKQIGFERTIRFKNSKNDVIHVFLRAQCEVRDNVLHSVFGIMMDVSKQKAIERYLSEEKLSAEKLGILKQDFLANMSHEIRTPMNSILGFTEIILENDLTPDLKTKMNKIKTSSENLLVIINDILDFTKIESGQLVVENIEYDLKKVIDYVNPQMSKLALEKGLKLNFKIDKNIPEKLFGDPVRLGQILLNLVSNAVKFTEKGFVEIRVKSIGKSGVNSLQFEIQDTGIGINNFLRHRIFDSYTQASKSNVREYGGTGLGLSISKKLVHFLGGKIWLESELNVGSTFYFTIDVNKKEDHEFVDGNQIKNSINTSEIKLEGVKILLVEDNSINRELLIHFLNEWGVNFQVAVNGKEGVNMAEMGGFDLILMDLSMPLIDGFEATRQIRGFDKPIGIVPIIAMTANAFNDDVEKCLQSGMNDYISKPFRAEELKFKIYNLIKGDETNSIHKESFVELKSQVNQDEKIFSLDLLKEMGGDNINFINDMIRIYIEESPKTINKLKIALDSWDVKEIKSAAHKLRSPSAMMRVSKAVELTEFIELNVFKNHRKNEVKSAILKLIELIKLVVEQAKEIS